MARILIIDDDIVTREILNEILGMEGYHVAHASNGKEGIKLHRENPFDLIITDIIMPEMEGLETIREIRHMSKTVKIIAISGGGRLGSDGYLMMADKMGAHLTLQKPLDPQTVVDSVQTLLD